MTLKQALGVDKVQKLAKIVKELGGVKAALKKRYIMDQTRVGKFVGEDKFGNKYYEDNSYFMPRNRWVEYPERVWLDYDATQIPPEWHRWIHHMGDQTPVQKAPEGFTGDATREVQHKEKWMMDHRECTSIYDGGKYIPYSTTRQKIQGWTPPGKK